MGTRRPAPAQPFLCCCPVPERRDSLPSTALRTQDRCHVRSVQRRRGEMAWKRRARGVACAPHMHRRHSGATEPLVTGAGLTYPSAARSRATVNQPVGVARAVEFLMMPADGRPVGNQTTTGCIILDIAREA